MDALCWGEIMITMVKLLKTGTYQILGTREYGIMIFLDEQGYHWSWARGIGELLTLSRREHRPNHTLAQGQYRIYNVKDDPDFTDLLHLELALGAHKWQGYLLLTGLPDKKRIRRRIVPTEEVISR